MQENLTRRITAITIATHRPEDLAQFYQLGFGWDEPKWKGKDHCGFDLDNDLHFGFDRIKQESKNGAGGPVIWFRVADVRQVFNRLISLGARVRSNVEDDRKVGETVATLFDPDGNIFGLIGPV
jgi:predicted enzyme related to lactoylglutathione lyase